MMLGKSSLIISKIRARTFVLILTALTFGTIFWYLSSPESMPDVLFSLSSCCAGQKDLQLQLQGDSQSDPELLQLIRKDFLKPPSKGKYGFKLKNMKTYSSGAVKRLHDLVAKLFQKKTGGFFIECGAFDGVDLSNTLHLEVKYRWTGLLIEADPKYFARLKANNRNAWTINACLAVEPVPHRVNMTRVKDQDMLSQINGNSIPKRFSSQNIEVFEAQCFPLYSILAAKSPPPITVDYFSLDVESAELPIFKTIPWDQVYIKVISAEDDEFGSGPKIKEFLESKGYRQIDYIKGPWIHDLVFAHERFIKEANLQTTKKF